MVEHKVWDSGCVTFSMPTYMDSRGYFTELSRDSKFEFLGTRFKQSNLSFSVKGVVRGMHLQWRRPQGKLVRVLQGSVLDCVVDVRPTSKTFMQAQSFSLSSDLGDYLYVPPGFAHGFQALEDTLFHYQCTEEQDPSEFGLSPLDRDFQLPWQGKYFDWILSDKDRKLPERAQFMEVLKNEEKDHDRIYHFS